MRPVDVAKPLGVFVLVLVVVLAGTAIAGVAFGSGSPSAPDGRNVSGQSPSQFQPDAVNVDRDPETGNVSVDAPEGQKRVLVDTQHGNSFDQDDIAPVVQALREAGHTVDFAPDLENEEEEEDSGFGAGSATYNATLRSYDALLVISPTEGFTDTQREGLKAYTEADGRVVVLGDPPQVSPGGLFSSASTITFGADDLTAEYGALVASESLYNVEDAANDNNFRAINAEPAAGGSLTDGVGAVTFEDAGYLVTTEDSDAQVLLTAAEGTKTLDSRRDGTFATAVRNDNMVVVADSDFISRSEVYDADNEVFVSNLLNFLVSGDKPDDVPENSTEGPSDGGF